MPVKFTKAAFQWKILLLYPSFCSWCDGRTTGQSVWNLQTCHRSFPSVCHCRQSGCCQIVDTGNDITRGTEMLRTLQRLTEKLSERGVVQHRLLLECIWITVWVAGHTLGYTMSLCSSTESSSVCQSQGCFLSSSKMKEIKEVLVYCKYFIQVLLLDVSCFLQTISLQLLT